MVYMLFDFKRAANAQFIWECSNGSIIPTLYLFLWLN